MSTHFSANQYEDAFRPYRLKNWEVPKGYRKHPRTYQGCTEVIGTDRGHLMESVCRSTKNPWGNYVGTWDLPKQIPGQRYHVPTARSADAQKRLSAGAQDAARVLNGTDKNIKRQAKQAISNWQCLCSRYKAFANSCAQHYCPLPSLDEPCAPVVINNGCRSGAQGPASKMIPKSNTPEVVQIQLGCDPCTGIVKTPSPLPVTPPEVDKIPTPGLREYVTPPPYVPGQGQALAQPQPVAPSPLLKKSPTPVKTSPLPPISNRTPTPLLKADSPGKEIEPELMVE